MVPIDNILYVLRLRDIFGCVNETSTFVLVNRRVEVFIPNAFSPDGDGYNDQLTIFADPAQVKQILHLEIFSRWGDRVFSLSDFPPNDERFSWDGKFQGQPLPTGMYVYSAQIQLVDDTVVPLQGEILLTK
jgi:gliding motility-associated-like protein